MAVYKGSRTSEDIKREIMAIMRELKDPRLNAGMLTIVRAEITGDRSYARVFVSSLEGIEEAKAAVEVLQAAVGFFRRELGSRLHLRKAPEILFIPDNSIEQSIELFRKLKDKRKERSDED